ncbi:hypothetical protein KUCAC02_016197 [Chaenocephalus aceratus]|uniref:Uncharacterized protein n=1 Tax=Chaenocephalus aceratus TaxID=36190 RepID=A0ACB9Y122_CHAAC|nr:hypothetical protein KUCAC02_016197 [Chaenocephalus aceratus]
MFLSRRDHQTGWKSLTLQVEQNQGILTVQGFLGDPDTELTPRLKVWEQIQAYLCTYDEGEVQYNKEPEQGEEI